MTKQHNNRPILRIRRRLSHPTGGEMVTEQSHEKACNINSIMARYVKTGLLDHVNKHSPQYGDCTGADFKAAQDLVAAQRTIFEELPAAVRKELDNDPALYLDMVMTPEGREELRNILNPAPAEPENVPAETSSSGTKDGEAEQTAVT